MEANLTFNPEFKSKMARSIYHHAFEGRSVTLRLYFTEEQLDTEALPGRVLPIAMMFDEDVGAIRIEALRFPDYLTTYRTGIFYANDVPHIGLNHVELLGPLERLRTAYLEPNARVYLSVS